MFLDGKVDTGNARHQAISNCDFGCRAIKPGAVNSK
jgi:hypothetical protein